ncbi:MAG: glutamine--fructose-6-phosphate transaminase (isomerizing) [bacterium]
MCGIFGYIGKGDASQIIVNGLKRLEYRGYDSWGVAVVDVNSRSDNKIKIIKKVGAIGDLNELTFLPKSNIGLGHTRWATHGGVTTTNAHPHYASDNSFVLAQNGIVENYQDLKKDLITKGHLFKSQTDTEVIVRLIEEKRKTLHDLRKSARAAFLELKGRNTIILMASSGEQVIAVRNGSPLVIGVGDGEYFFASDTLSFADKTDQAIFINDHEMGEYFKNEIKLYDVDTDKTLPVKVSKLDHDDVTIEKEGFKHFMLKEIVEQKYTIREAIQYSEAELKPLLDAIGKARNVYTIGAGTANYAASQIAYFLRKFANIRAIELKSYEVDSFEKLFSAKDLVIAVSQSGETADTIEAVEIAKKQGCKVASIVNMVGSTLTRISDYPYFSRSGPEICVASTKAFTAQISWGLLVAKSFVGNYQEARNLISDLTTKLEKYFDDDLFKHVKQLTKKIVNNEHFFVLGRGQNYYIALEAALKIKEISYKHFEGFAAGELKHGVIALIEKGTPVFIIASNDSDKDNMLAATAEVKSRGAYVIGIGQENNELFDDFIATIDTKGIDSLTNVIPFQLLSYYLALELDRNPDKPRNLAKSVTVK